MKQGQLSIRLLMCLCLPLGLLAIGCNQPTESPALATSQPAADGGAGECCAGSKKQCACATSANQDSVNAKKTECGDCNACAEGNSAACKCGHEEPVSAGKDACRECPDCAEDTSAVQKCDDCVQPGSGSDQDTAGQSGDGGGFANDRDIFHFLLENHDRITRRVENLDNGVETFTESDDPAIAEKIQEHVASMYYRVENAQPIRMRDPLYREIFKHTDKIEMKLEKTENGIHVKETSDDEYVVKLIQEHASVVSGFVKHGFEEARKNHDVPQR